MTIIRNSRILWVLCSVLAILQSCHKDEIVHINPDAVTETKTDTVGNGIKKPDTDADETSATDRTVESENGEITRYRVDGDKIIKELDYKVTGKLLEYQKDTLKHIEIWELTKKIIPPRYRSKMSHFAIFSGDADGTAGYVYSTVENLSKWEMGIAIEDAYYKGSFNADGEVAYTIIHEFGHILTLNDTQVDVSVSENDCKNFHTGEGCAKKESYINGLYSKFWADIWEEFIKTDNSQSDQEKFYNKYEDRFVTAYASTNPGEDIAEVFATFVTRRGGVKGKSIAEQKIQLMYDRQELIAIRDYIRGNLNTAKERNYLPVAGTWKKANTFGNHKEIHCSKPKG